MTYDSYGRQIKAPKGAGQRILYLDFDGVLHHEDVRFSPKRGPFIKAPGQYTLFQHAPLLEELLVPYPDIKIVLSTAWVRVYSFSKATKRLPASLRERCIGATYHSSVVEHHFIQQPRGMQVANDVYTRKPSAWLALDDDHKDWPRYCLDNYVRTHEHDGISDPDVLNEIKVKLASMAAVKV